MFRLGPAGEATLSPPGDPAPNCFRFTLPPVDDAPRVCTALVKRVERDKALLHIFVSPEVLSGYAEVELAGRRVTPGEQVRVRLIEKRRGRWSAAWT